MRLPPRVLNNGCCTDHEQPAKVAISVAVAVGGFALVHARRSARTAALAEAAVLTEVAGLAGAAQMTEAAPRTGTAEPTGVIALAGAPRADADIEAETADAALAPVDKLSWRMPPLSELPTPVIRGARRIGLLGLRGYLAIAMVMVIVKIVETALGH